MADRMRAMTPGLLVLAQVMMLQAQPRPVSTGRFEVASIKRCQNGERPSGGDPTPGRLHLACVTTASLIRLAYLVFPTGQPNALVSPTVFQMPISGGPSWIDSDRFSIDAKAEGRVNVEMMKGPMMQRLLEERFGLRIHRDSKQTDIFELAVAKNGPKLRSATVGQCVTYDRNDPPPASPETVVCGTLRWNANGGFDVFGATMMDLSRALSAYVDREIVDRTGIAGRFDIHLDWSPADGRYAGGDAGSSLPPGEEASIASAMKKIGLQIRSGKGSTQTLVIDHVDPPTEN